MCLSKLKKWFCGECKPEVIVKTETEIVEKEVEKIVEKVVEKIVEKPVKIPTSIVNDSYPSYNRKTPVYNKLENKKIYDYIHCLNFKGDYYSQYRSINTIEIDKNEKYILIDNRFRLYSDGEFLY